MTLEKELREQMEGEVRFDAVSRKVYSVDASLFEIEPLGIVIPKTEDEVQKAVSIATHFEVPLIPRGAATGITGGCIGRGLIIDTSKYLNRILEIDPKEKVAIVEPGVVQDTLNQNLAKYHLQLGPETSTGNRATLGGMLANNAAGSHSIRYGKMVDAIEEVDLILADGSRVHFGPEDRNSWDERKKHSKIYQTVDHIRTAYSQEIEKRFPKIPRRVSGYNLDEIVKLDPINLSKLIAGSEGTLGIATKIKVRLEETSKWKGLCLLFFDNMSPCFEAVPEILSYSPFSLEMIDWHILAMAKKSPFPGKPEAVLVVEFDDKEQLEQFYSQMKKKKIGYSQSLLTDPSQMHEVWSVRKAGLELLLSKRSYTRAIAFIEDIAVAPQKIAPFMKRFFPLLQEKGIDAGIYGHIGAGCLHIRPYLDLRERKNQYELVNIMQSVSDLLLEYEGAMSGEHGDGIIRSWLHKKMFGKKVLEAFCKLKTAFDPMNLMNPGKIVTNESLEDHFDQFRRHPEKKEFDTYLDFSKEGGFSLAVDLCNGNGMCRKTTGLMCPSFHATRDEYDTTRARAQALRGIVDGTFSKEKFSQKEILDVLDLCIECKGCKTECPSQVDMAKMKAEFLYQYQKKKGASLRSRLFANLPLLNRFSVPIPQSKWLLSLFGITPQRSLPKRAPQRFSTWWKQQKQKTSHQKVMLFIDTFTEYHCPEIGKAAVKIFQHLQYEVIIPPLACCGRTWISKGFLEQAKKKSQHLADVLYPYTKQGIPIVGLEPSCLFTLVDEMPALLGKQTVAAMTIDQFLCQQPLKFSTNAKKILVHGHCHQKALIGTKPSLDVLKNIPNAQVEEIPSGCCGMAGSFGYEKEHYDISMKIGEHALFPAIEKEKDALIVANGFSCRNQIQHATGRNAVHLVELLAKIIF